MNKIILLTIKHIIINIQFTALTMDLLVLNDYWIILVR